MFGSDIKVTELLALPDSKIIKLRVGNVKQLLGVALAETASKLIKKDLPVVSELTSLETRKGNGYMLPAEFVRSNTTGDVVVEAEELKLYIKDMWSLITTVDSKNQEILKLHLEVTELKKELGETKKASRVKDAIIELDKSVVEYNIVGIGKYFDTKS